MEVKFFGTVIGTASGATHTSPAISEFTDFEPNAFAADYVPACATLRVDYPNGHVVARNAAGEIIDQYQHPSMY